MKYLYLAFVYLFVCACKIVSLFNSKVKTMCRGQKATWQKLAMLDTSKKNIWFHCASLGEFEQARNLIEYIKDNNKDYQILLSFFSPSGYEIRKNYEYADCVVYLPFDTPKNAKRFVQKVNPQVTFFIKYEFWWNYIKELKERKLYSVSLILRKNHYLFKFYSSWYRKQLKHFDYFFVQDDNTSNLLNSIGYKNNIIAGDTRFDRVFTMSKEQKEFPIIRKFINGKKVFLAGSSWPEDERIIAESLKDFKDIKMIIAPHLIDKMHIDNLLCQFPNSITYSQLSKSFSLSYDTLIIDNIGMLMYLYSLCDFAYIGGGFSEGIHNILEAAVFSKPVAFGPNNQKFKEANDLIMKGAAKQINNTNDLCNWISDFIRNEKEYERLATIAGKYVRDNIGATGKIINYITKNLKNCFLFVMCGILFASCSPNKHLSKNGYLLSKNTININNTTISKGDIVNYIQQDPNHKFLGFKAEMYIYSLSSPGEDSLCNFFEKYFFRAIGDKPIEIDDEQTEMSIRNIKMYLKNHGCFNTNITTELSPVRRPYAPWSYYKRRRKVNYNIDIYSRAVIDTFIVQVEDPKLSNTINSLLKDNTIKRSEWYNEDKLSELRTDITQKMLSRGYYAFNEKYIAFNVDTTEGIEKTKIVMLVKNPSSNLSDSLQIARHKPYKITKIYLHPNYISPQSPDYVPNIDTVLFYHKQQKGYKPTPLYFINNTTTPIIKEKTIMRSILMQNKNLYSPEASQNTYSSLSQLRNFKYIDISYQDVTKVDKDTNELICFINLTRSKPINLTSSFELNYSASDEPINNASSSNFGMAGNLSYIDKNLLHGAEIFSANLKLAAEINSNILKEGNKLSGWDLFNAFEAGVDFGIELPRFLAPFSTSFYSMKFHPHTSIRTGYNVQKRSYYNRSIFNLNYGYSWNTTEKKFFAFIPLEINFVNMDITSKSYANFIKSMDRRIQYQMSDHFVMAMRFSYNYNGQTLQEKKDFNYFSWNIETAGNLLDLYSVTFNQSKDDKDHYTIFKIPFSQYVRTDFSFVHYNYLSQNTSFVYKIYGGMGISYGNADALPYEKAFFGGGANGLRAWRLRSLGPGSSKNADNGKYDRAGDIAFGANFEYRFPMMSFLEGATFFDIGNIWNLRENEGIIGGKISERFYKEIAAGAGLGIRLNFGVMIIRFDFALKVWDPSKELKERFVLDNSKFSDIAIQFGIGYPF